MDQLPKLLEQLARELRKFANRRTLSIRDEADFFGRDLAARWLGDARKARKRRRKQQARANRPGFAPHRRGGVNTTESERHAAEQVEGQLAECRQQEGPPRWKD
jgi:hypothetical protein